MIWLSGLKAEVDPLKQQPIPYHEFLERIREEKKSIESIRTWLKHNENLEKLGNRCGWCKELIALESNNMFYRWYGGKKRFEDLTDGLRKYLSKEFEEDPFYSKNGTENICKEIVNMYNIYCTKLHGMHHMPTLWFNWRSKSVQSK